VNPVRDLDIISEELRLKDEENLMKHYDKLGKLVTRGGGDKKLKPEFVSTIKLYYIPAEPTSVTPRVSCVRWKLITVNQLQTIIFWRLIHHSFI
jgi:ribosome-binding ATPase YchF (GTP1/OBG family)